MPDLERNKQNVMAFYDLMFNECRPREAIEQYTQHNSGVADGKQGFNSRKPLAITSASAWNSNG